MAAHELAAALAAASETDKATLAQYVLDALERAGVPHEICVPASVETGWLRDDVPYGGTSTDAWPQKWHT